MKRKKYIILILAVSIISCLTVPTEAAAKKKITSVSLDINLDVKRGQLYGEENLDIETKSSKYTVSNYALLEEMGEWGDNPQPEIEITLTAEEGNYFYISKKSDVLLKGNSDPMYVSGRKEDSASTLIIVTRLESIFNNPNEITRASWDSAKLGSAIWESEGASNFEIDLYCNGKKFGSTKKTSMNSMELLPFMTKQGYYTYRVRSYNQSQTKKGAWHECSENYVVSDESAIENQVLYKQIYGENSDNLISPGVKKPGWYNNEHGWWYQTEKGTYPKGEWLEIDHRWYYFNDEGYMQTGWIFYNEKWYYCDDSGALIQNSITPDGYIVNELGEYIRKGR